MTLKTVAGDGAYRLEKPYVILALLVGLLLLIFASRIVRLDTLDMDEDEVWSVWQTFGTPAEIVNWTPSDWSPLYYLIVGLWKELVGIHPFALRLLSVLPFLLAIAVLYRFTRRVYSAPAGLIAAAACAAMGYTIHVSTSLRAYSFLFLMAILAWWLAVRYFTRPALARALPLALCLSLMVYLHISSLITFLILGVYTLIIYEREVRRWWLPGVITAVLILPVIVNKISVTAAHVDQASSGSLMEQWLASGGSILFQIMRDIIVDFAGYNFAMWAALMGIAAFLIFDRYHLNRSTLALAVWVLCLPFLFFTGVVGSYTNRHLAWLMLAFAIWIGLGFQRLPRAGTIGLLAVLVVVMFGPAPITERYKFPHAPLVSSFHWLSQQAQAGDAVLIDSNYTAVAPEEWDYYTQAYFPRGLNYVTEPGSYRRVWYIFADGQQDQALYARVQENRMPTLETGTYRFIIRLYESPPDVQGIVFENGLRFHGAEALDGGGPRPVWREGQQMKVRLWWSVDHPLPVDLSVGTYVLDSSGVIAQFDGPPQPANGPPETSRWQPGQFYIEEREIQLPYPLSKGAYTLFLAVYQWWDNQRLSASGVNADKLLPIMTFSIRSW